LAICETNSIGLQLKRMVLHLFWFRVWNWVLFTCSVTNVKFGLNCLLTLPLLCTKFVASNRTCFLSPTSSIISTPLITCLRICCIQQSH
jgi:hypothetical protein